MPHMVKLFHQSKCPSLMCFQTAPGGTASTRPGRARCCRFLWDRSGTASSNRQTSFGTARNRTLRIRPRAPFRPRLRRISGTWPNRARISCQPRSLRTSSSRLTLKKCLRHRWSSFSRRAWRQTAREGTASTRPDHIDRCTGLPGMLYRSKHFDCLNRNLDYIGCNLLPRVRCRTLPADMEDKKSLHLLAA